MAVASLILGIIAIIFVFTGPFSIIGMVFGIIGIILGAIEVRKSSDGVALGGLITSIIGTVIILLINLACIACWTAGTRVMREASQDPAFQKSFKEMIQEAAKDPQLMELQKALKEMEKVEKQRQQQR